jgi:diguanylate cyclase (GGDEF)-like protein/PAS domain S-box-containing protein
VSHATKILVVGTGAEDQRAQRSVLATAELNWELDFCDSGEAALAKIGSLQPHCIVLDYRLSDMDGLECFQAIHAVPGNTAPVLMLIAQNDEAAVVEALRVGVQDYLFKDARGNYLALLPTVLKRALREHHATEEKETAQAALLQLERKYEYLFLGVADGIVLTDEHRIIESINPSACAIFSYDASELCGRSLKAIMRPAVEHAPPDDEFTAYLNTGSSGFIGQAAQEVRGVRKEGQVFPLELTITEINLDERRMFALVMRDTSERHRAKEGMQESEARFRGAFDNAPIGMALISLEGNWLKVNQSLCDIVGYSEPELLATRFQDITHPDDLDIDQTFVQLVLADQLKTYQMETRYFHKDGHTVPVMLNSSLVRNTDDKPLYFISKIEDITQRKRMEDALFAEKDLAQTTLESIGDAVITTDAGANVTYLNPMAERLTGWSNKEACGLPLDRVFVIVNDTTREVVESPVKKTLADGKICGLASNTILIAKNGLEYSIDNSAAPIRVRDGSLMGAVMVFHDVTEARALTRKISFQASHDALTGLCNRSEFELMAARLVHSAQVMHLQHVLLFLDLDQFKAVNDTCGHLAGDQLLRQLSNLLLSNTRKSDMLARLGGDEFGILLEGCPHDRALEIAQHLVDTVRAFRFEWEGKLFSVGVSIGLIAINDQSKDLQTLLNGADTACYIAKDKGRNRVQVFEYQVEQPNQHHIRIDWVTRLHKAVEQNRFSLYYQKIQPIEDDRAPHHHEVLLRYQDEHGHILLPMAFIPVAEHHGLLPAIDRWVIQQIFRNPPSDLFAAGEASFIAINISGSSFADVEFQHFVVNELHASDIPADKICFEISEATAITHLHRAIHFIQALKGFGCQFALDDFGSGLSAFGHLKSLPVDYLKIDGSIIKAIAKDPVDYAMAEATHRIAKVMGIKTIAKFVESEEILNKLRQIGIDYAQGFGLHLPEAIVFPVKQ